MALLENDDIPVAEGRKARLVYARRADGTMEAKEWLESESLSVQASFDQLFRQLVNCGPLFPNKEQFKKMKGISGGIVWEFKRGGEAGNRLYCVEPESGDRWLLTNHYRKGKGDQTRSAKLAVKIAREHHEREEQRRTQGNST